MGRVHYVLTGFVSTDSAEPPTWASRAPYPDHRSAVLAARTKIAEGPEVRIDISQIDDRDSRTVTTVTGDGITSVSSELPLVSDEVNQVMADPHGTTVNVGDTLVQRRWRSTSISTLQSAASLETQVQKGTRDVMTDVWNLPEPGAGPGPFRIERGSRSSTHRYEIGVVAIGQFSPTAEGSTLELKYHPTAIACLFLVAAAITLVLSLGGTIQDLVDWLQGHGLDESSSRSGTPPFQADRLVAVLFAAALTWWTLRRVRKYRREIDREIIISCAEYRAT